MDWQQKAAALDALADISIMIRKPGDWYVSQSIEIKDGSILRSVCGNGSTPELAVLDHWQQAVDGIGTKYLITHAHGDNRRAVRWSGFMWVDVPEPHRQAA